MCFRKPGSDELRFAYVVSPASASGGALAALISPISAGQVYADDKIHKKRKRKSEGLEASNKKVAFGTESVKVSIVDEEGLHPVLASAPGLVAPTVLFTPYSKALNGNTSVVPKPRTHQLLLQSSKHPRLDYTASSTSLDENLSHYVAVYDPRTKSVQVIPAHHVSLRSTLRSEAQEVDVEREVKRSMLQLREELGREFGTRKAKKAILDKTVNAIVKAGDTKDKGKRDDVKDAILDTVDIATAADRKKEDVARDLLAAKPIPKPNVAAESVEDVYSYKTLVPPGDARLVAIKDWQDKAIADEAIEFNHRFPAFRVQQVAKMEGDMQRLKALGYLAALLDFNAALQPAGRSGKKVPKKDVLKQKLADWPMELVDSIRRRFANHVNELPKWHMENLYTHMCALTLFVDDYTTVTTDIRDDLGLDNKQITQYFQELGCKVGALSEKERELRKFTKAQAAATRVAKLKLPLEFPKPKSGKRK
nr:dna-directed rna polymerase i subunit rpa49 [Quercus suber]